jgi:tetratricopeptide (TPR) repeat protein
VEPQAADDATGADGAEADEAVDFESLYAAVTPSAHAEMGPEVLTAAERNRRKRVAAAAAAARAAAQPVVAADPTAASAANPWKRFALALGGLIAVLALLFVGYNLGSGGKPSASGPVAQASATAPAVDEQKIAALMVKLQANPNDLATLLALGDEYYAGGQYTQAASFYDQLLGLDPKNVQALLARGAVYFNTNDLANAEKVWKQVAVIEPNNQEVHYDLGFLYMNQPTPNWTGVQTEWYAVVRIDPTSQLAKTVQQHLDSLVTASMIPATPAPSGSASGSPAPSGSPAASTSGSVVNQTALNTAFGSATLIAPASQAFTIHFDNQDSGVQHAIQITDPAGNVIFKGDTVTGPNSIDYAVKAMPAGSYPFSCSVHPSMTGILKVGG